MVDSDTRVLPFGTLVTAMVTPFTEDGAVDFDATAKLANKLVEDGCDGLVVSGTTGETSTLEDSEKEDLFRVVAETVGGRAKVIAGTGTNHTSHSVEMARRALRAGADAQLVVTPYYNKPTQAGVVGHFEAVAAATDLPIMVYDIPGRAGIAISTDTMIRLANIPAVMALKDAKADFAAITQVLANTNLDVYAGDDGLTLPWMAAGAVGVVSVTAHVATAQFRALVDAAAAGDFATARRIHFELDPLVRAVMTHIPGAVSAKQILAMQGVIPSAAVRLPLVAPDAIEMETVLTDLAEAGWDFSSTSSYDKA
ncbi:4-hydroxy-tetrahydrodipicolinate synthase [Arthrobacter sp. zg-Y820]|uniref:4-hydroxy-tetrahydrodipicolinate synthase n=1 Tax=unclassified Arthrobacter TaxID=235627 RepID=UPI001E388CED|nr:MULTISPECIES: 4-hydroxy-tetrahydrodipicolinate synthase [unclassified Arthrobacter]MCC9198184.1 4-hydroxy-tetrahydrodipicolinate synthase [Arthrobacter sp. zg-Y820]MDK1281052.1 4-hydroxy-tetrahydrodipicolinate synthase [Arthrobacter sp. zg.Y820]MDK1360368.1 4-hydroxy-tetrahydrodipicolinate synthase [Arthrobacter sp. zg-Y1219]WIB10514.1 4-hydroxy-tetrahydrodipicolinate synthase [Arthrobacter sp. zg-Y820]